MGQDESLMRAAGPNPPAVIRGFLSAVRARLRRRELEHVVGMLGLGVAASALVLLLAAAALGPWAAWPILVIAALLGWALAGAILWWRARSWLRSDDAVARLAGRALPFVGDELLSAVELGRELPRLEIDPILSPELVRGLELRVADRLVGASPAALVDLAPARRLGLKLLAVLIAAYGAAALVWPRGLSHGWALLRHGGIELIESSNEPLVGDLRLTLVYPPYTKLGARDIPGSSGQVLALPGTTVHLEAHALRATAGDASVVVEPDGERPEKHAAELRSGAWLRAEFLVRRAGGYRFVLGSGRRRVQEAEPRRIEIEPDRPPRVELYAPAGEPLEVAESRRIELGYSIDDDYGITGLELVWRQSSGKEGRRSIALLPKEKGERVASGKFEWDLGELDLKPGARVAYHLEAKDNDNVSGPNKGSSRTLHLSVFSPREKQEAALSEQQQVLEQAVGLLADRLEFRPGENEDRTLDRFGAFRSRTEALLAALGRLEQTLGSAATSRATRQALGEIHDRLSKLAAEEARTLADLHERRRRAPLKAGQARALEAAQPRHVAELEKDVLMLDDLLGRQRLEELLAVGDEMARARDRLKSLLEEYRRTRSDALKAEIERELRQLERRLAELQAKASRLASELPDEFVNSDAMRKQNLQDQLGRIRELMARGDVEQAMAELEKMSSSLGRMMAGLEGGLRSYRRERFSAEEKALAEMENRLRDLEHDEQQLKNETQTLRERTRAEARKQMRDRIDPLLRRAKEKVAKLKKSLGGVEPPLLGSYQHEELDRVRRRVDDLEKMLDQGDLDEARGMAEQASQGLKGLSSELRDQETRVWRDARGPMRRAREQVEQGEALARELADEMGKALPKPSDLLSEEEQRRLSELAERQEATRRRATELGRQLARARSGEGKGEGKGEAKGEGKAEPRGEPMGSEMQEGLREAARHMERAGGRLKGRALPDALGEESAALERLGKLKEQLEQQRRPRDQMAGGALDKEPVKIPGAEEYRPPKEFRQDLLEAMKRSAPAEYKQQIKRYYEELAK